MKESAATGLEPIRKKVVVAAAPAVAFERFTKEMGEWWPLATHSVHGAGGTVEFGAGAGEPIVERDPSGEESTWGTITEWDPPRRVEFTWHPGRPASTAQEVTVTFLSTGEATEVTLVHGGWESLGEAATEERGKYEPGWDPVLEAYRASI